MDIDVDIDMKLELNFIVRVVIDEFLYWYKVGLLKVLNDVLIY